MKEFNFREEIRIALVPIAHQMGLKTMKGISDEIENKFEEFIRRLKERNEEIRNPKICPICKKKLSIADERGGYCSEHYWIVPSYFEWVRGFEKEIDKLCGEKLK